MKFPNGQFYVEVKDCRHRFHPTEIILLRERYPPKSLKTQYQVQVQNETQVRKNQKVIKNINDQLIVEK